MADWSYTPPKSKPFDTKHNNPLPKNWKRIRERQLRREPRCEFREGGVRCIETADEVDHIQNRAESGTHDKLNLQSLCSFHHAQKTSAEGHRAWEAHKKAVRAKFDLTERHPLDL